MLATVIASAVPFTVIASLEPRGSENYVLCVRFNQYRAVSAGDVCAAGTPVGMTRVAMRSSMFPMRAPFTLDLMIKTLTQSSRDLC